MRQQDLLPALPMPRLFDLDDGCILECSFTVELVDL